MILLHSTIQTVYQPRIVGDVFFNVKSVTKNEKECCQVNHKQESPKANRIFGVSRLQTNGGDEIRRIMVYETLLMNIDILKAQ